MVGLAAAPQVERRDAQGPDLVGQAWILRGLVVRFTFEKALDPALYLVEIGEQGASVLNPTRIRLLVASYTDPFGLAPCPPDCDGAYQRLANWGASTGRGWALNLGAGLNAAVGTFEAVLGGGDCGGYACGMGVPGGGGGFRSFGAFKTAVGPAGAGKHWHHIVGQTRGNVAKFGAEAVHSSDNLIAVDAATHARISGFYSSKPGFTGGKTVRDWLSSQSFEAQREFGIKVLRDFGVIR